MVDRVDSILLDDRLLECVAAVGYTYKKVLGQIVLSKKKHRNLQWDLKKDLEDPFKNMSAQKKNRCVCPRSILFEGGCILRAGEGCFPEAPFGWHCEDKHVVQ